MTLVADDVSVAPAVGSDLDGLLAAASVAVSGVARAVAERGSFDPAEADAVVRRLDRIERSVAAAKLLLAGSVAESSVWRDEGFTSPAGYLASVTGSSMHAAHQAIAASKALPGLAETRGALLAGTISTTQALVIADAAKHDPTAQQRLIRQAKTASHKELRDEALRVKAKADPDPDATFERTHAERHCSTGTAADGAWTIHGSADPVQGSAVNAELDVLTDQIFRANRSADAVEGRGQYRMDALALMAANSRAYRLGPESGKKTKQAPPQHLALLRVDVAALQRGQVEGEELCEIAGVGPVPIAQARLILGDAALRVIITKGEDILNVTTVAHSPKQATKYAMLWSNPYCVVEGCGNTIKQFDHRTGVEYADTRHTTLSELDNPCSYHHMLHTRHGWALVEGTGKRPMVPPDDPRHPLYQPPPDQPDGRLVGDLDPDELRDLMQVMRDSLDASNRNLTGRNPTPGRSP
jgi:hypothetical protein